MSINKAKEIYKETIKEIDSILHALKGESGNIELAKAMKAASECFEVHKNYSDKILNELDRNAEWDALTIALYGETNAGKSTIIETLRILLGEKTKKEQQLKFRELCDQFGIDENTSIYLEKKNQELQAQRDELNDIMEHLSAQEQTRASYENNLNLRSEQLKLQIKYLPVWRKILSIMWKTQQNHELKQIKKTLTDFNAESQTLNKDYKIKIQSIKSSISTIEKCIFEKNAILKKLEPYQDGGIIGDGQSDFTRETTSYTFTINDNKFVLIDVPGIEGKEELVREPIMQAVSKAHVVLYITRKADPPQKGDEKTGEKGTLEKIKEHLSAQTEVWAVFNKSIKSAEQLRAPQLINKGESDSLNDLDHEMRKQLGEHYAGKLVVSAYPAFIASTNHFLPGNTKSKDRSKFLSVMDTPAILEKTEIKSLAEKISSNMAKNAQQKIRNSNFNKANNAVRKLIESIISEKKITFGPLFKNLDNQAHDSNSQLENAADSLKNSIEAEAIQLVKRKRDSARKNIYEKIDRDISNDDFKYYLNDFISVSTEEIKYEFPEKIKSKFEEFQEELKNITDQFHDHVQEFLEDASMTSDIDFNLSVQIDNGVSITGLISTAMGAVALIFTSGGWVLAIGAVGLVVSFGKAIWGFFDSDYKKAQQRKAADENINDTFQTIESRYISQLVKNMQELEDKLTPIKNKLQLHAQQTKTIILSLEKSIEQLELISKKIMKEGGI